MLKLLRDLSFFIILCCILSCQRSVTYVDESRKPPIPPNYYRSSVPAKYDHFYQPGSRRYQNPYGMAPKNYYPYYDIDHYYVPPAGYNPYDNRDNEFKGGTFDMNNIL